LSVITELSVYPDHLSNLRIEAALFGQDALAFDPVTLEATPSGALIALTNRPWTIAQNEPTLRHNPWATHPLPIPPGLPWASVKVDAQTGHVDRYVSSCAAHARFGLEPEWPGPGDPFSGDA
jgi:hypothetical protein